MPLSEFSGVASSSIAAIDEITSIAEVTDTSFASASETVLASYGFDDQTANISNTATGGWAPSLTHSQWANGSLATSDASNYWAPTGTPTNTYPTAEKSAGQWRCDYNATGSSSTGPDGALNVGGQAGTHSTDTTTKYIYTETSGAIGSTQIFVCRTPGINLAQVMSDNTNDAELRFWVHGYGDSMDRLTVWVDDAATSSAVAATEYASFVATHTGTFSAGTTTWAVTAGGQHTTVSPSTLTYNNNSSSLWVQVTISLNSLRQVDAKHYVYFTFDAKNNGSGVYYRGDLAIDQVEFVEVP